MCISSLTECIFFGTVDYSSNNKNVNIYHYMYLVCVMQLVKISD